MSLSFAECMDGTLGLGKHSTGRRFGLDDLGVLEGPPLRGAKIVVETAHDVFACAAAATLVFDEFASAAIVRSATGRKILRQSYSFPTSVLSPLRSDTSPVVIHNLAEESPDSPEGRSPKLEAVLAAPVFGLEAEPIGALAVFDAHPRIWSDADVKKVVDLAHLVSQEIVLLASFQTLRIMSDERIERAV